MPARVVVATRQQPQKIAPAIRSGGEPPVCPLADFTPRPVVIFIVIAVLMGWVGA
ncbi:MAG: hypothetical protein J4F35_15550 [Candidatus Latescibacteria bacterium]|nr:hypothetical protein [Candidatus Latescibacterota bacterium]